MTPDPTPLHPEVLEAAVPSGEATTSPTKLIRIASMVRALLDEARRAPLDEAGRRLLGEIHDRSLADLSEILSGELKDELSYMTSPFLTDTPTESELRIAQAQLVGWLEGLFHGIQATMVTQQIAAQQQIEAMRSTRQIEGANGAERLPGAYL